MLFDLKTMRSALDQLEEEKGISREKIMEAIEMSLAAAYKKEYGKKGQIVRAKFDMETGNTDFSQVKIVVDESIVKMPAPLDENGEPIEEEEKDPNKIEVVIADPSPVIVLLRLAIRQSFRSLLFT